MPKTYNLLRLEPTQVGNFWNLIKTGLVGGLASADRSPVRDQNILEQLVSGGMQCWFLTSDAPEAVAVTQIYEDAITKERVMLIYSLYSFNETGTVPIDEWVKALNKVRAYAHSQGCAKVVSYTNEDRIREIYRRAGGVERYSYMVAKAEVQDAVSNGQV